MEITTLIIVLVVLVVVWNFNQQVGAALGVLAVIAYFLPMIAVGIFVIGGLYLFASSM